MFVWRRFEGVGDDEFSGKISGICSDRVYHGREGGSSCRERERDEKVRSE